MKRRRLWLHAAFAVAAALLVPQAAHADPAGLTKGPYIQNMSPTAVTILWEADTAGEGSVRYGSGAALAETASAELTEEVEYPGNPKDSRSPKRTAYLYRARITGLKPATAYRYQVVLSTGAKDDVTSDVLALRTWPEQADQATFIVYGDSRTNPAKHAAVVDPFARYAPAFILHLGDLTTKGENYAEWSPQFFDPLADLIDHLPMFVVRGSHDGSSKNVLRFFDMPGGRTWYSFDYGPVHVAVLDSKNESKEVLDWLERDLAASTAPWKIVACHEPMFNLDDHRSDSGRKTFLPIFERNGVALVLAGHSHIYERFHPLVRTGTARHLDGQGPFAGATEALRRGRPPITFVTTGGGGAPLKKSAQHPLIVTAASTLHYCVFTVDRKTLHMQALLPDGTVLDAFAITRQAGRYDAAYLAEAAPMEEAILAQGLARIGTPQVQTLPARRSEAVIKSRVRFPGLADPVTITARLSAECADAYAMEPLELVVKPGEEASVTLKVRVLAAISTERDESAEKQEKPERRAFLRPALRFSLTARSGPFAATWQSADVTWRVGSLKPDTQKDESLDQSPRVTPPRTLTR